MKRSNIVIILLVLVALFLAGCGGGVSKPPAYSVSGKIVDSNGNGIPNVTLGFSGSFGVATTDNTGRWSKAGLNGDVTITPVKDSWTFETKKVTKADSNVNFTGIRKTYPLTVTTRGEGTVNDEIVEHYEHGNGVQLIAVPETGWSFSHWEGDLEGSTNPATIVVDSEKSVTAVFVKLKYVFNIAVEGEGFINEAVVVSALSTEYEHGTQVRLTAMPEIGWRFSHWEGDLEGSANPATIVVDSEKSVTAVFVKLEYALNIAVEGEGTVNEEVVISAQGTLHEHGTQVRLTAVPETGWRFSHWEGDLEGSANPATIKITNEKTVKAVFVRMKHELFISVEGKGSVERDLEESDHGMTYDHGTKVKLTAVPEEGSVFSHWEGDITDSKSMIEVVVDSDLYLTAVFLTKTYRLNIEQEGDGSVQKILRQGFTVVPWTDDIPHGATVQLRAHPANGWIFRHWLLDDWESTNEIISFTVVEDRSVKLVMTKTIQARIDEANDGDVIIIPPGHYPNERIAFGSKRVTLQSIDPSDPEVVAATVISGNLSGLSNGVPTITFLDGAAPSEVSGFTIKGGTSQFVNDSLRTGSALFIKNSSPIITNNIFEGSSVYFGKNAGGSFVNNVVRGNSSLDFSLVVQNSSPIVEKNLIENNLRGGIRVIGSSRDVVIRGNTINNNTATSWYTSSGGGIFATGGTIEDNIITNNTAEYGGGLYVVSGHVKGNSLSGNSATRGGAIYATPTDSDPYGLVIADNQILTNIATLGGGVYAESFMGKLTIDNNVITGNYVDQYGGGIYVTGYFRPIFRTNTILQNTALSGGGILVGKNCNPEIFDDNTVVDNNPDDIRCFLR